MNRIADVLTPETVVERMYADLVEVFGNSIPEDFDLDLSKDENRVRVATSWVISGKAVKKYGRIDTIAYLMFLAKNTGKHGIIIEAILKKLSEYDKELAKQRLEELRKPVLKLVHPER